MRNLKKYNEVQIVSVELRDLKPISQLEYVPVKHATCWRKAQPEGWRWKYAFSPELYTREFLEKGGIEGIRVVFVDNIPHYGINVIVKYSDGSQRVELFHDDYEKAKAYYDSIKVD